MKTSIRVSHHRFTGTTRHSPRNGLRLLRDLLGEPGLFATVARAPWRELDSSVGEPEQHDLTVRKQSAVVYGTACVHRIPPRERDDRVSPLYGTGRGRI